ncbi:cytochrome P450 [Nocardiopsis terrae]|uniref:Cytochrome P450 n=1 Tax=Nocardiopsis terrae TaxID=372655 RepID=A0ABR9HNS3_9ACTN|nr:cytochrome P450 [Nocardiopsis terrae]MBE1460618.1 cytochrome P450 [Nocardiopsis terrae]GHC72464.1 cytochrome P450 [Nocardiopsis terrae]
MTTTRHDQGDTAPASARGCPGDVTRLYGTTPPGGRDALWERLREQHGPVAPVELEPGVHAWLLLDYQENLTLLQQPHLFSRDTRHWREAVEGRVDLAKTLPLMSWHPSALYADGAEHARLRTPIMDALARVDMTEVAHTVRLLADERVDAFTAAGVADLIGEYAGRLPVLVVNRLFGLPDSYGHMLGDLTTDVFGEDAARADDAITRMQQYFAGLVARKADKPGPDLATWMLEHPVGLAPDEVAYQAALMVSASHMPTTHLIGNTMRTLLTDDRIRSAHADARLSTHDLLDHVMWTDTPFQILAGRIALQDVRIGQARIRAGDALLVGIDAAHRDPAVRRGPADPGTGAAVGSRAHLVFGAGPHSCPARGLGRLVASTAVDVLQERLGGLRLAVPPEELRLVPSAFLRGLRELPVTFTPGSPVGRGSAPTRQTARVPAVAEEEQPPEDLLGRLLSWWRGLGR